MYRVDRPHVLLAGAPQEGGRQSFIPTRPEDIEPILGIIPGQFDLPHDGRQPELHVELLHYKGPEWRDFWLGQTIKGESGQLRRGIENRGDFCVTHAGDIAVKAVTYRHLLDRTGSESSIGLMHIFDETYPEVRTHDEIKQILARGIFYLLNPSQTELGVSVEYIREMSIAEALPTKLRYLDVLLRDHNRMRRRPKRNHP